MSVGGLIDLASLYPSSPSSPGTEERPPAKRPRQGSVTHDVLTQTKADATKITHSPSFKEAVMSSPEPIRMDSPSPSQSIRQNPTIPLCSPPSPRTNQRMSPQSGFTSSPRSVISISRDHSPSPGPSTTKSGDFFLLICGTASKETPGPLIRPKEKQGRYIMLNNLNYMFISEKNTTVSEKAKENPFKRKSGRADVQPIGTTYESPASRDVSSKSGSSRLSIPERRGGRLEAVHFPPKSALVLDRGDKQHTALRKGGKT
ncbi:hypothetical protein C0993_000771, partial [Termitomyces sp. T159_Od127]